MTLKPMDVDQLAELVAAVGSSINPASPELAVKVAQSARKLHTGGKRSGPNGLEVLFVLRRLVDAETALATLRNLIADLVAEIDDGDEVTTDDVIRRLAAADMRLCDEIAQARALRTAHAATAAL